MNRKLALARACFRCGRGNRCGWRCARCGAGFVHEFGTGARWWFFRLLLHKLVRHGQVGVACKHGRPNFMFLYAKIERMVDRETT